MSSDEESSEEATNTVVIDNGSWMVKAGLAEDDYPRSVFRPIVGVPKEQATVVGSYKIDTYVGDEAWRPTEILYPTPPTIENGVVTNWEDMEKVWHHTFYNELRLNPAEYSVIMSEPPHNPKENREKTIEAMFEVFNIPAFYLANQAVLSIYSTGRQEGIVLDSGEGFSHAVPVRDGHALPQASKYLKMAGKGLNEYLRKLLSELGKTTFMTSVEMEVVRDIKEKLCYVAENFDKEMESFTEKQFKLPDGKVVSIGNECLRCPEALFQLSLAGINSEFTGLPNLIQSSVTMCEEEFRQTLYKNIVISGGTTLLNGMSERLQKDMDAISPSKNEVIKHSDGKYAAFIGGCLLGSLPTTKEMLITKDEYTEFGPSIVHRKCV